MWTTTSIENTKRLSLKELMFRSTIYNRHEARRAKTLLRKGDTRPALLRVLAPAPALTAVAPSVNNSNLSSSSESSQEQPSALFEDESVFTLHDMPPQANRTPLQSSVSASMMAAAAGAAFSEAVYGARCLRQASPFASSRVAVVGQPQLVISPEYSLTLQHTIRSTPQSTVGFFQGVSQAQVASRAAPFALLFGAKSAMEHLLSSDAKKAPPAAISILSSAAAGGVLGALRSVIPSSRLSSNNFAVVGREIAGATLYFSVYDGVKHILVNQREQKPLNPLATAAAGALAGVVYDSVRVYGQHAVEAPLAAAAQTRSLATVVVRAAPSHALLFLGYETTLRLVSSQSTA